MAFPLTQEQRRAVDARGGEILVSAAAGSGKTRVLVERLLDRVTRDGEDIDRFLVITYTRAAAAELRERIAQELTLRLAEQPHDSHLRRQLTLIYKAQISTIHSFCSVVLRESGHTLGLSGEFRLCDEGEEKVMMQRELSDLLDELYEDAEPGSEFFSLVDTMAAGRDDSALERIVLDIYGRIQSHPDPLRWLQEQKARWDLEGVKDAAETIWGKEVLKDVRRKAVYCREQLGRALALCDRDEKLSLNYAASISASIQGVDTFLKGCEQGWDEAHRCLPIPFPTPGRKSGVKDVDAAERMKSIRTRCKKDLEEVARLMEANSLQVLEDLKLAAPAVRGLMDLVAQFTRVYAEKKLKRGLLDFSDLEHYTVRLFTKEDGVTPSPLAQHWSGKFAEVMVDEYQDTNQVQNVIFRAVSDQGRKLFQVGDVKQSIYRFRLADPTIFLGKYLSFPTWEEAKEGEPRSIVLSRNFRSREQVLEGCNDLFRRIMSREFGELDYTQDQALVPGAQFPPADRPVELALLDLSECGGEEEEKVNKNLLEARWAAARIRRLLDEELLIGPEGDRRPLEPGDVMILLRSPGTVRRHYVQALEEQGIPWVAEGSGDIFETTEVNAALSLLQVVDNPRQDVALISVLRSPVYGFSGDKLARLRCAAPGDFYSAVVEAAGEGDAECRAFLEELEQLRFGAGDRTCRQLIWHIYEKTNLLGVFGTMDGGDKRQDNLLQLYNLAGRLEQSGCRTLFQFLLRLDRLRQLGNLPKGADISSGGGVSLMSIHRSKGLEKPVVLVCGLSKQFNREDSYRSVLFHAELGVGPRGLDRERMVEYPTLARMTVAEKLEQEMMAEELRLLYVAMTRAREKLILSVTLTKGVAALEKLRDDLSVPPSPMALARQQSVGQWILLHALTRPEGRGLREIAGLEYGAVDEQTGPEWDMHLVDGTMFLNRPEVKGRILFPQQTQPHQPVQQLEQQLRWSYPRMAAARIPSKLTATQIKGRVQDEEVREEAQTPAPRKWSVSDCVPNFAVQKEELTPAQRGTALHLAMQYLPLEGMAEVSGVERELERLEREGYLTAVQRQGVDPHRLAAFFASPLGQEMSRAAQCRREFKFMLLVSAQKYFPDAPEGETVLLQGVIDAWFDNGEEITILDFKSDRVTPRNQSARAQEYLPQLEAYTMALEEITGRKVGRRILWFFATDSTTQV